MDESRLERIKAFAIRRDEERAAEDAKAIATIHGLQEDIKALAPRIKELIGTANQCYKYGIQLGPIVDHSPKFVTDSVNHRVGFFLEGNPFNVIQATVLSKAMGIGIAGGGAAGDDLFVNADGTIRDSESKYVIADLRKFVTNFDAFESEFNKYIDELTK